MLLIDTGAGPHHQRRRDQADARRRASVRRRGCGSTSSTSRTCRRAHAERPDHQTVLRRQQAFGYTQEDLRLLLTPMALRRRRADRLDGHRHRAGGAVGSSRGCSTTTSRSSSRRSPTRRSTRSARSWSRRWASTIGPEGNLLEAAPEACRQIKIEYPSSTTTRSRSFATCRPARRSARRRCRCCTTRTKTAPASSARWPSCAARPAGGRGRLRHPDPVGPRRRCDARAHSQPARHRRRAPSPGARRHARTNAACWSRPATRARCITSRCSWVTAPARSTRTWRSRHCTT